jgi:hypothetical protein
MTKRAVLILIALSACASEPTIMLGVLEEIPGGFAGESQHRAVRVSFQKKGREWQPFPSDCPDQVCLKTIASEYPPTATWTIAFSGRSLGQITAATPKDFEYYSGVGLQTIASKGLIPSIGKKSADFSGFLATPVLRPLIAASQPYFKDPDSWKPAQPSPELAASLRVAFRKKFPKVSNCTSRDVDTPTPWLYRDADIKLNKAYSSNKGWFTVQIQLTGNRCEGPTDDPFIGQWFAVTSGGDPLFLGAGLWLVDAGDYDNDGKSELVFAIDRYNQGGYELFYDDFKSHAVFQFNYH